MAKFFLRKKAGSRIVNGHPWVFANEIGDTDGSFSSGDIVDLFSYSGSFIGKGYVNTASQIRIRLLTRNKDRVIDSGFFSKKIKQAWQYRQQIGITENCRLVHAEADGLPGLIIDKYNDYFVVQSQALGMEQWLTAITKTLEDIFSPKGVYLRNDTPIRRLEGLELENRFLSEPFDTNIKIEDHGVCFYVDVAHGHKTGFQLDHHLNKKALENLVNGANVLDVFCYSGSFGIHAAKNGANSVLGIDLDAKAIELARQNALENNCQDVCSFKVANAFDILKAWSKEHRSFDIVILDPPPFGNSKSSTQKALIGYKEINLRALKLLKKGGFLATTCNTHSVSTDEFKGVLIEAAKDAGKTLKQYTYQTQSPDHPILWNIPTTKQLDFFVVQAL